MSNAGRTVLVVPCYDEAERFSVEEFQRALDEQPGLDYVLVDDGSKDGTLAVLNRFAAANPGRVHVLAQPRNRGKAEAVRSGVLRAFTLSPRLIGYWDADLATPLSCVPDFENVFTNPNVMLVLGSRVSRLGSNVRRDPLRHYIGRGFATVIGLALGIAVYDTQCGAKLFRATPVMERAFAEPFEHVWTFDAELLVRLLRQEREDGSIRMLEQCVELPLSSWHDKPGSKIRLSHTPRIAWELGRLLYRRRIPD